MRTTGILAVVISPAGLVVAIALGDAQPPVTSHECLCRRPGPYRSLEAFQGKGPMRRRVVSDLRVISPSDHPGRLSWGVCESSFDATLVALARLISFVQLNTVPCAQDHNLADMKFGGEPAPGETAHRRQRTGEPVDQGVNCCV